MLGLELSISQKWEEKKKKIFKICVIWLILCSPRAFHIPLLFLNPEIPSSIYSRIFWIKTIYSLYSISKAWYLEWVGLISGNIRWYLNSNPESSNCTLLLYNIWFHQINILDIQAYTISSLQGVQILFHVNGVADC